MKTIITILALLTFGRLSAQINSTFLDHNNVSATISDVGTYFLDYSNSFMGYEVPKGSGQYAIYTTQFWFAGKDQSNEIRFIQGGTPSNGSDIFNGPISDPGTYSDPSYQTQWGNSMWEICQSEIDIYKTWWEACNGPNANAQDCANATQPSTETLNRIYSWPAHGDVSQGQSYWMAPFYDNPLGSNGVDGVYDPGEGDYPIIKGCCAVYMIQNDAAETHTYSSTDSLGVELHFMFYQYQTWDYLNDVTFVDIKAVNRSNANYTDFVSSIYVDADLGFYGDDYYGCDSASNTMYFYNGDNLDEDSFPYLGYGIDPPTIGIVGLDSEMTACAPFYSGASVNEKWNIMHGLQSNGSSWLNPNSDSTKFVYSGNPNVAAEWSALSTGLPPNDVRGIASFYHGTFNSGETLSQTYAITFARNGNNLDNVNNILNISNDVKLFHDTQSNQPCNGATWGINESDLSRFELFPNPTSGILNIVNNDLVELTISIYNSVGQLVEELNTTHSSNIVIDLSGQSKGVYTVKLLSEKGVQINKVVLD